MTRRETIFTMNALCRSAYTANTATTATGEVWIRMWATGCFQQRPTMTSDVRVLIATLNSFLYSQTSYFVHGVRVWCVLTHTLALTNTQTGDVVSVLDMTIIKESSSAALRSARTSTRTREAGEGEGFSSFSPSLSRSLSRS